ncbi:alpha/beta hydrolase [Rhodococcus ruber]|uniref:Alpha/beta hydrolase n=1 Tax=Rhodococcus ruber TaxID=1830 RepID=A0ABT4MEG3_9NOCA|nr:alpha/beta hydrolase [Rhodococcus ruber]MCZ4519357.1 alpha/beta hydrolase [Rhodococcus ruber]
MPWAINETPTGKVRLHWDEQGSGEPVVLVMGHLFSGDMWYPVIPALAEHYRVIWFDNRGTGESSATSTATVADMAADVAAVMDAAKVESAHVYGVSMGGGIVLQLAHDAPARVRSMVLGCTAMRSPEYSPPQPPGFLARRLKYRVPIRVLKPVLRKRLYGPIATRSAVECDLDVLSRMRFSARGVYAQDLAIAGYDMTPDRTATLTQPALVLHGTADEAVPHSAAVTLTQTLPNARLVTYEGAGHNYPVDVGARANVDVLQFLADRTRKAGNRT